MDKLTKMILLVIMIFLILGCSNKGNNDVNDNVYQEKVTFQATILDNKGTYLIVKPNENSEENSSADIIHVSVSDVELLNENDNKVTIEQFIVDMEISIKYNGMIAESYPAQINKVFEIKMFPEN